MKKKKSARGRVNPKVRYELASVMHFALLGMQYGANDATNWKDVAKVLLTISMASDNAHKVLQVDRTSVHNAILVLRDISDRQLDTKNWAATDEELVVIAKGVLAAERILPNLNYKQIADTLHDIDLLMGLI